MELEIVNKIVGAILCCLNNGIKEDFLRQPKSYGASLIWQKDPKLRDLKFTYWEYGIQKAIMRSDEIKEILPNNLKPLVDCIHSFDVNF